MFNFNFFSYKNNKILKRNFNNNFYILLNNNNFNQFFFINLNKIHYFYNTFLYNLSYNNYFKFSKFLNTVDLSFLNEFKKIKFFSIDENKTKKIQNNFNLLYYYSNLKFNNFFLMSSKTKTVDISTNVDIVNMIGINAVLCSLNFNNFKKNNFFLNFLAKFNLQIFFIIKFINVSNKNYKHVIVNKFYNYRNFNFWFLEINRNLNLINNIGVFNFNIDLKWFDNNNWVGNLLMKQDDYDSWNDFEASLITNEKIENFNNIFYKYLLRDLINFEENFFFQTYFSNTFVFYNFISHSYFNFFMNINFISEKLFDFGNEQLGFSNFNDYTHTNLNSISSISEDYSYIYNNHLPILLNKTLFNILFFSDNSKLKDIRYINFYKLFINNFFESVLKKSIFFKIDTNFFKKYKNFEQVEKIVSDFKTNNVRLVKSFHASEMLEIIWYSFEFKDLNILSNWIIKTLNLINLKNHKKFLNLFQSILIEYSNVYLSFLNINGFFFKIKGKIGLTGNAKKKQLKFKIGKLNLSDRSTKTLCEKGVSKTNYGVLGFVMILSF